MTLHIAKERQRIVKPHPRFHLPAWNTRALIHGPDKAQRAYEVRGEVQQPASFGAGLEDETQLAMLQISQSPVDKVRRATGGPAREVALVHEHHTEASQRGIACDPGAGHAAAHDQQVHRG